MIVASHQPHFFPWLGYMDKMAKCDLFLINDVAQLTLKSPMVRNKILTRYGHERYINITVDKAGYTNLPNRLIRLKDWIKTRTELRNVLFDSYGSSDFFHEIWPHIEEILAMDYNYLIDIQMATIKEFRNMLSVETPLKYQSHLEYDEGKSSAERIVKKANVLGAEIYMAGNGARKYLQLDLFESCGIELKFQEFSYPQYKQKNSASFIPNLSTLDMLFNCGIEGSRELFWSNLKK